MKKIVLLLLVASMCFSMCACGKSGAVKSEAVQSVEKMIDSLGNVSYESKAMLDEIETAYERLSKEEKEKVDNYDSFVAAKEAYINEITVFAEKLTEIFDIKFVANTCKIDGCWYYYDQKRNAHFFTYYVCAINGSDGRFYGNVNYNGFSDLSEETLEREITYQFAAKNSYNMVNGEFCVEYIKYGEKYALENGIELDAERIHDYFMKKFY